MIQDEVLFTPQLATVVVDLRRRITRVVASRVGISYLAFCLLSSVRSHGGSMNLASFPRNVLGNENTVVVAAAKLAKASLVEKRRERTDGRVVVLSETPHGAQAVEDCFDALYDHLRATVWCGHSDEDVYEIMYAFPSVAEKLGVGRVEINNACHSVMTPAFLMIPLALLRRWEAIVQQYAGLSFNEYRCLSLLETRPAAMGGCAIADALTLDRSAVSSAISKLHSLGFVSVLAGEDRRSRTVSLTDKGEIAAALTTAKLGRLTAELYSDVDALLKAKTNELHMRMHTAYATKSENLK